MSNNIKLEVFTHDGVTKSLLDWSEDVNIPFAVLLKRLTVLNWSFEKAITTPDKKYLAHGKNLTLTQWSQQLKIPQKELLNRLSKPHSSLDEVFFPVKEQAFNRYKRRLGNKSRTIEDWCEISGIPLIVIQKRMYIYNMTFKAAMYYPYKDNEKKYIYEGESKTLLSWSKDLNFNYQLLFSRVVVFGLPFVEAVTKPVQNRKKYNYKGQMHTINTLSRISGLSYSVLYARLVSKKWSVEKSMETPKRRHLKDSVN